MSAFDDNDDAYGITVAELLKLLEGVPRDAKVQMEGCDCFQPCFGVEVRDPGHVALRNRQPVFLFDPSRLVKGP